MSTPSVVVDALLAAPLKVAGLSIRSYSLQAQLVLERIDHPILRTERPSLSTLQNAELIFILAGDEDDVIEASGQLELWADTVLRFCGRISPADLTACVRACMQQLNRAFAAAPAAEKKSPQTKSISS